MGDRLPRRPNSYTHRNAGSMYINALHFGHPGESKMLTDSNILWWPGMAEDIKVKTKECISCRNAGKKLKTQIPQTEKSKILTSEPGEELQLDFTGDLISDKLPNRLENLK